ncbi:MAG: DEAD/DEAH box helicase family protein [Oscillospiraceae bacterium]|nr:DEAD/DEAH box helicase family protein [Oscillospiraceae bacterium]
MTNFDFLRSDPQFDGFARVAISAEKILHIDPAACTLNCRRAMEFAIKWLYSVDNALSMPDDDRLVRLMDNRAFRDLVGEDLWKKMKLIRSLGNNAAHDGDKISRQQATLCLENLFDFLDFVAYCYSENYKPKKFDISLVDAHAEEDAAAEAAEIQLERLIAENAALRADLTARRENHRGSYVPRPLDHAEYATRKIYIEALLLDAGWTLGEDCAADVDLELGEADYVLNGSDGLPLAIIEARRSCVDMAKGRQQAELCADILEKRNGRRPTVFLTDGFDIYINDGRERRIAAFYSRSDLERRLSLTSASLEGLEPPKGIADRKYQREAVSAACSVFSQGQRRALLAMSSGSGKTRVAAAVCALMLSSGRAKNILYLAENSSLAAQAKDSFSRILPELAAADLCCGNGGNMPLVFATWQTMAENIDNLKGDKGRIFTCGRFDLIVCDEAHGAATEKYRDVFNYFDAPMLGMTIAPSEGITASVYELFGISDARPTYVYDMSHAVRDGFLVDFRIAEAKVKFLRSGIQYQQLSAEDKAEYRLTFASDDSVLPDRIGAALLNRWVLNADTIREALAVLMKHAIYVNKGKKIGKTIIFASSKDHAELIFDIFREMNPRLTGYAKTISNDTRDRKDILSRFADPNRLPQIIIADHSMESGVDFPHVVNLVFFKKVRDKARFWQMIGRGARPCSALSKNQSKSIYHIFDLCGNFEYFRSGRDEVSLSLEGDLFLLRAKLVQALQEPEYHTAELKDLRETLARELAAETAALDRGSFAVRQHLRYVEFFSDSEHYSPLTDEDIALISDHIAPLISTDEKEEVLLVHRLIYNRQLALLRGEQDDDTHALLSRFIPAARTAAVAELDRLRRSTRLQIPSAPIVTDFDDELLSLDWLDSGL